MKRRSKVLPLFLPILLLGAGCHEPPDSAPSPDARSTTSPPPPSTTVTATARRESPAPEVPPIPDLPFEATLRRGLEEARAGVVAAPDSGPAWGRFGQWCEAAEMFPEARTCYARAAVLDEASPRWPHLLGLLQLQDEFEAAVRQLDRAIVLGAPTNEASRVRLAQALVERGRGDEARPHLDALLATRPDHAAARLEGARVEFGRLRFAEAAVALGPCLTNPFTARPAVLLLAQIRAREGRTEEAAALARRGAGLPRPFDWPDPFQREVQALRSDPARVADRIQALLGQRRFAEADAALADVLATRPEDPEMLLLAGRSLLQQRRCREAEDRFRAHLRVSPDSLNGRIQLALSLLCQQRWSDAAVELEHAIASKPDFAQAHANLGLARSRLGDGPGALRAYREALRCSPGEASHHAALAEELARQNQPDEARRHASEALRFDPAQPRARALLERLASGGK